MAMMWTGGPAERLGISQRGCHLDVLALGRRAHRDGPAAPKEPSSARSRSSRLQGAPLPSGAATAPGRAEPVLVRHEAGGPPRPRALPRPRRPPAPAEDVGRLQLTTRTGGGLGAGQRRRPRPARPVRSGKATAHVWPHRAGVQAGRWRNGRARGQRERPPSKPASQRDRRAARREMTERRQTQGIEGVARITPGAGKRQGRPLRRSARLRRAYAPKPARPACATSEARAKKAYPGRAAPQWPPHRVQVRGLIG